ncbi:hypothetical protein BDQ12DRAFT_669934 [Crucibulum laeve]|uniref:Uncharacterized protein n=1 Tax=Crucibulum laeve TaxID=68775 RepID=A0A5C3LL04_9AGAR|nr:hypothetical protein BDQ12DRAFT_669934 [Crucibulum laeve]
MPIRPPNRTNLKSEPDKWIRMEATFDNTTNILNARIRNTYDKSIIYNVTFTYLLWGRKSTQLKDPNPALKDSTSQVVGTIRWKEKIIEVNGHRKPMSELKKKAGRFGGIVSSKSSSPELYIEQKALAKDKVFLVLVVIYSEVMRQDRICIANSDCILNGAGGW